MSAAGSPRTALGLEQRGASLGRPGSSLCMWARWVAAGAPPGVGIWMVVFAPRRSWPVVVLLCVCFFFLLFLLWTGEGEVKLWGMGSQERTKL